jgi:hypothetical protein
MHSNRYWLILLTCLAAAVCWKSGEALYRLFSYYRLTAHTQGRVTGWSVVPLSEEFYLLQAHYRFRVGEKEFEGDNRFQDDPYLNAWSAEKDIKKKELTEVQVWYSSRNPLISTLQKKFPLKECLSASALWILFLYFIWLGYYVGDHTKKSDS